MDYLYEQLGDERFQHLCQALLVHEHPDVQCLPVGQPDGGRDAIRYVPRRGRSSAIVYQVKYVRKPQALREPHKWLLETIKEELPKIRALVERGASAYYLLTNVSGTAHPDVGAIDLMQEMLDLEIVVDAHCWWRDDLSRRLDGDWDVKWSYPEVWSGKDLLRALVESGLTEDRERREAALRAFLRDQYNDDREVRFKQIELQNNLLDLFVDVPLVMRHAGARPRDLHSEQSLLRFIALQDRRSDPDFDDTADHLGGAYIDPDFPEWLAHDQIGPGAASALLHPVFQKALPMIVLEGAPGQGKSTLVQYVCQVHRM